MNKVISLLLLTMCVSAALAVGRRSVYSTAVLTASSQAAPNTDPNITLPAGALRLAGVTGYRITLCAPSAQTLGGAGSVQIYYFPASPFAPAVWTRNPTLDETVSVTATSCAGSACQCQTFADHESTAIPDGWIYAAPKTVTLSGGTTVTVLIEGVSST